MLMNSHHSTTLECQHPYRKLIRALITQRWERPVPTTGSNEEMAAQSYPILNTYNSPRVLRVQADGLKINLVIGLKEQISEQSVAYAHRHAAICHLFCIFVHPLQRRCNGWQQKYLPQDGSPPNVNLKFLIASYASASQALLTQPYRLRILRSEGDWEEVHSSDLDHFPEQSPGLRTADLLRLPEAQQDSPSTSHYKLYVSFLHLLRA